MSRIAKEPVVIPSGVDVKLDGQNLTVKGAKGEMSMSIHNDVCVE
ncbi:MAG: 50S ribosomal protein L6, partial [Gammaproteobacteria bacterium]|nr:50S ribosomal protein L6 [Gammaproteobacteria bacterium]